MLGRTKQRCVPNKINSNELPKEFAAFFHDKKDNLRQNLDFYHVFNDHHIFQGSPFNSFKPVTEDYGASKEKIRKLQIAQNSAARLVCKKRKKDHVTPLSG
ncbi:hypothetical protein ElyMa_000958000 [Elysia marginata]|uniref:Uncharacterized protein n=1 Tax=Elysia marginata TaxID=1093978 RepID=A0AAV4HF43_9GAST|nr:hypothetical protein ElyMa_000958000 [Elysia marginata]